MPVLLSLETSTDVCSVAIHRGNTLLATAEVHMGQAHASKLAPLIEQVARMADVDMAAIQAVAVAAGPGSYTGLRIGTSTAKGLCYALGIPLISVGTLDVMAEAMHRLVLDDSLICPMIDARRMEVYCALYDKTGRRLTNVEAKVIDDGSFREELLARRVVFAGNGSGKCREVITHPAALFVSGIYPSAKYLGLLAAQKLQQGAAEDLVHFEPFYLKDFKAKLPANIIGQAVNKPV